MKRYFLGVVLCTVFSPVYAQLSLPDSLALLFRHQLEIFPQEKIYVHTDKPWYIAGEKIRFRAYVADAITHIPMMDSRYVYIELIDPLSKVVTRVRIMEEEGAYHGHLPIPDDIPEGDYTLRAYTAFMRNLDEHCFFTQTLHIGDTRARTVQTETRFFFDEDSVYATFLFTRVNTSDPIIPKSVKVCINNGKPMDLVADADGKATVSFRLLSTSRQRIMLLEVTADAYPYRRFIYIPAQDKDFDVAFFPEGGALMSGTPCRIVFKAIKSDGQATEVSGKVYSRSGREVGSFTSDYLGMGSFLLLAEKGEAYFAVCENDTKNSKQFEIPAALDYGYALSVTHVRDNIHVALLQPAATKQTDGLYLMAHTRGMIHLIEPWHPDREQILLPKELFPSGVLHLILFDACLNPISERLVFINNRDQAQTLSQPDREEFAKRSFVKNTVTLTDHDGHPLTGSFSVSVTSDREVTPDSTFNILTQLLLSSDLRGHIENPAYYFQRTPQAAWALDLLMCTQGWRRYNIAALSKGASSYPAFPVETEMAVTGKVKGLITGAPVANAEVFLSALTLAEGYYSTTKTDSEGRFRLPTGDLPDSTRYIVSTDPGRGVRLYDLTIDQEDFPAVTISAVPPAKVDTGRFAQYLDMAERQYAQEGGLRITQLLPAVVTAERSAPRKSQYYSEPTNSLTQEQIARIPTQDIKVLLQQFTNVQVTGGDSYSEPLSVVIRGLGTLQGGSGMNNTSRSLPLLLIDDIPTDFSYIGDINVGDIAQIDLLKGANAAVFGMRGGLGVISIHTKKGDNTGQTPTPSPNIKIISPQGYLQHVEFYAPRYDTPEKKSAVIPDLRTTIHWQPVVQTDSHGMASFEFYTADEPASYTVIMQGLTSEGTIIQQKKTLWPTNEHAKK